jgi:NhaP-type Na+/H+ or K+/H+ antiporter
MMAFLLRLLLACIGMVALGMVLGALCVFLSSREDDEC